MLREMLKIAPSWVILQENFQGFAPCTYAQSNDLDLTVEDWPLLDLIVASGKADECRYPDAPPNLQLAHFCDGDSCSFVRLTWDEPADNGNEIETFKLYIYARDFDMTYNTYSRAWIEETSVCTDSDKEERNCTYSVDQLRQQYNIEVGDYFYFKIRA